MQSWHYQPLLEYWFGNLTEGMADSEHRQRWFQGGAETDAAIEAQFLTLHQAVANGECDQWLTHDHGRLAYIIVLDQLSRSLFRGTQQAFAYDEMALVAAKEAIATGLDLRLPFDHRAFLYMPFEHSEDMHDQEQCLALFQGLLEDARGEKAQMLAQSYLQFAQSHYDIIRTFGRYPHRNAALGRPSRQAEIRYLAQDAARFGQ